ncbi:hypothetical protein [Pseudomonas sp. NPDC089401]|uniref:hypothetical protein n=1 Tax=Pseudomonas sp. NPDC089401 TaxID=3364462 RepID=UPI00380322F3
MEVTTTPRTGAYAPRNLLNADALKRQLEQRSLARGDAPAVRAWLLNHFYRHLVGNFEPARKVHTLDQAATLLAGQALPAWVARHLEQAAKAGEGAAAPLAWVDPEHPAVLEQEALLVEFLGSRQGTALEGKLERINCPQALALWHQEHARMAARQAEGWRQSRPEALRRVVECDDHVLVELLPGSPHLREEMAFESYVMRHCLGQFADRRALRGGYGESYAEALEQGRMRIFSLRDKQGQPHITLSLYVQPDGSLRVDQLKGKQNRPPVARYLEDVLACLDALGTDRQTPADCLAIGVVRSASGWCRLEAVNDPATQAQLIVQHPQLFDRFDAPSALVEWLVAARQPECLRRAEPRTATVRYALRHLFGAPDVHGPVYATEGITWPGMTAALAATIGTWLRRAAS